MKPPLLRSGSLLVLFVALGSAGCQEELGPEPMRTARVTGRVHIRNQPVTAGWIEFYPIEGTVGYLRSARLRPDGSFCAEGVAVGPNAIKLADPRFPASIPRREIYARFGRDLLIRRTVANRPETAIDIDLQDEWAGVQRQRAG